MTEKQRNIPKLRFPGFTDAWEQRKLLDCLTQPISDGPHETPDLVEEGIPFISVDAIVDNKIDFERKRGYITEEYDLECRKKYSPQRDDVYLVKSGSTVGKVAIVETDERFNIWSPLAAMRANKEVLLPKYLYYFLQLDDIQDEVSAKSKGGTQPNLSMRVLEKFLIRLPDVEEQKMISDSLSSLDNLITLHQRKCEEIKEYKKGMLQKIFPQEGEQVPEIRFPGFTGAWEQRKLSEVANRYDNLRIPVAANLRIPGSTPYYGANGIQDYVEGFTHEGEFVLVAEDGANDLKNYPVKCVNGRIWVNNHAHVLQSKPKMADNKFLAYSISRADIETLLVGGGRAKLNAEAMMGIGLFIPSVQEQAAIGIFLTRLDNLITLHQRKVEELKEYKKGLLQQIFV